MERRRRGGRKVIVAPPDRDRDDWAPPPRIDSTLVKALARAHQPEPYQPGAATHPAFATRDRRAWTVKHVRFYANVNTDDHVAGEIPAS